MLLLGAADARQLAGEEFYARRIIFGREFFDDRLGGVLHAGVFGRRDLVELHTLGFQFIQRLVRGELGLVALVLARLGKAVAQHLLLFRRQAVPELLADDDDVLRKSVVGGRDV